MKPTTVKGLYLPKFCHHNVCNSIRRGKMGGSGQVNWICGSNVLRVKTDQWVAGQLDRGSSRVTSWVELTHIFQTSFFLEIDAICQLFMNSLTVIKFSLVILLSLTNYHYTLDTQIWCNSYSSFLKANFGIIFDLFKVGRENEGGK